MTLQDLFPHTLHDSLTKVLKTEQRLVFSGMANSSAKAFLISDILRSLKPKKSIWIIEESGEREDMAKDYHLWGEEKITLLPESPEEKEIIRFLSILNTEDQQILLIAEEQLSLPFPSRSDIEKESIAIAVGNQLMMVHFFNLLIEKGYEIAPDAWLKEGQYRRAGGVIDLFPLGAKEPIKIEVGFDTIERISSFSQEEKRISTNLNEYTILPVRCTRFRSTLLAELPKEALLIRDDLDNIDEGIEEQLNQIEGKQIILTSFPQEGEKAHHLRYSSVLKFYHLADLLTDLRDKIRNDWTVTIFSKRFTELEGIFKEEKIAYSKGKTRETVIHLLEAESEDHAPASFQNPDEKVMLLTDKEIFSLRKAARNKSAAHVNLEFLTSLKPGDFIVHTDHGIGMFVEMTQCTVDEVTREYLEIAYAGTDKLFLPVDQADKISKFLIEEGREPKLNKLGGVEWKTVQKKIKKETEKVAKDLLKLYAERAQVTGFACGEDTDKQHQFESEFPYEETPGQIRAISDVKTDMESMHPMDRLVCGDVGFGKTEVAMRAAFKAVENKKQVAYIAPITILVDQQFHSFQKRMEKYGVRIEMLSRFRSDAEQKAILRKLEKHEIDIVIGTHRLLQDDIKFADLGLTIIDEEQRLGVKQKERLKNLRKSVDILTLTATPIPRTLSMSLNKIRDITTITTPPPGRLPIVTEVRRYSDVLVREAILTELNRKGQIYFLHNRVETIESQAHKLRLLVPEAKFITAHGQLQPHELEKRILAFKEGEFDVLISSTIIENGIDLPNANTMIVNNAEQFGLSQLYQLRGRIGRGKTQAYAYLLYHGQKLKPDAKKRLRAIVEATELGSGFQISMRDLEIRGAGDVLGVNQSGTVNVIGMSHYLRLLQKTIEEMQRGEHVSEEEGEQKESDIVIDLPIDAYIPNHYISDAKEKISVYQKLASITTHELLSEIEQDVVDEFGKLPSEVRNLFKLLDLKLHAKAAGLSRIRSYSMGHDGREVAIDFGKRVTPAQIMEALETNRNWTIMGDKMKIMVADLGFAWVDSLITTVAAMAEKGKK